MTILQFITEHYPIADRIKECFNNPYQLIEQANDLPFDKIGPDQDGNITKLVVIDDERTISVLDLISLSKFEMENDVALQEIYEIYMQQVELQQVNIADIMESVHLYRASQLRRQEQADVLRL